jgi:hypothetical protein
MLVGTAITGIVVRPPWLDNIKVMLKTKTMSLQFNKLILTTTPGRAPSIPATQMAT